MRMIIRRHFGRCIIPLYVAVWYSFNVMVNNGFRLRSVNKYHTATKIHNINFHISNTNIYSLDIITLAYFIFYFPVEMIYIQLFLILHTGAIHQKQSDENLTPCRDTSHILLFRAFSMTNLYWVDGRQAHNQTPPHIPVEWLGSV